MAYRGKSVAAKMAASCVAAYGVSTAGGVCVSPIATAAGKRSAGNRSGSEKTAAHRASKSAENRRLARRGRKNIAARMARQRQRCNKRINQTAIGKMAAALASRNARHRWRATSAAASAKANGGIAIKTRSVELAWRAAASTWRHRRKYQRQSAARQRRSRRKHGGEKSIGKWRRSWRRIIA